jgi:threonylcarbamoyladenosine tRNA methylthiotransferase MtaB
MRTFSIYTLGCKVNHYESAQIRQFFEEIGLKSAKNGQKADLCVINTCCVTATASARSRQYIQRATRINPKAVKIVCGCLTAIQTNELRIPKDNTTHIISNRTQLPSKIKELTGVTSSENLPLLRNFKEQTRAFLKIQDGCDGKCSYCIIPKVRPDVQSKPPEDVIFEAKNLIAAGHKEIVVTGVNLGLYGRQAVSSCERNTIYDIQYTQRKTAFSALLQRLAQVEGLKRLRVSSLEPGDITGELLDVFCEHKNIMPHIHLSVQSGSDAVLRRMCRPYSAAELREKIALIKSRLDRPALTCDIIVGFPGETDEDFEQTCELAKWAGFSKIHVFPFSAREGTAAAKMKNKVPVKVIKKRAEILRKLGDELGFKFREQFVGEECEVLIEDEERMSGHCERYFIVKVQRTEDRGWRTDCGLRNADCGFGSGERKTEDRRQKTEGIRKGEILKVKITGNGNDGAEGEIFNEQKKGH